MANRLPTPVFDLTSTVYQRAAPEADGGIVTGLIFRPGNVIIYLVSWGVERCESETSHWECELTNERAFGTPNE